MEEAIGFAILFSPVLLIPALLQRRWSRRRAIACLGLLTGTLTAVYAAIDWGGTVDERITRGVATIYGMAVSGAALAFAGLMFILNPPRPSHEADRG